MKNAIEVHNLSKKYTIRHEDEGKPKSLREFFSYPQIVKKLKTRTSAESNKLTKEDFWALRNVSFEVPEGQRIAVIGGNGAGKSTLLKILSRITEPTSGSIKIRGRVASLLEVGTGFHPELTGRENIFLNGAILGMRHAEISKKFDAIVSFSGVEKFIDTPVKHYSSGMYVRLAFSVSAWLNPDILIVDEVLSVGDVSFQKRCAERMRELTGDGKTVIFVSHSMGAVKSMCEKAIVLNRGEIAYCGEVANGVQAYEDLILSSDGALSWDQKSFKYEQGVTKTYINELSIDGYVECLSGRIEALNGERLPEISISEGFCIRLEYRVLKEVPGKLIPNLHFYDGDDNRFFISYPEYPAPARIGVHSVVCEIPPFLFNKGRFSVTPIMCTFELDTPVHFALPEALRFEVHEPTNSDPRRHGWHGDIPGMTRPRLNWTVSD